MAKRASSGGAADAVEAVATLTELSTRKDYDNLTRFAIVALVDEPERVTPAQMDRWCRELGAPRHWSPRPRLNADAIKLARRLADSPDKAARWIGKDALRDLLRLA